MPNTRKAVNTAGFKHWEVKLARGKAKGLAGKHGFWEEDLPDIEQELLLKIHLSRRLVKAMATGAASPRTIISRILDNAIKDIIDAARTDRRGINTLSESIHTEVGYSEDGDPLTLLDLLGEDWKILTHRQPTVNYTPDLIIDLSIRVPDLCDLHSQVIKLLKEGYSVKETADSLGIKRTTLYRELGRLSKILDREGLGEYL